MSVEKSPKTGRRYGVERVCNVGDVARSTYYAQRPRPAQEGEGAEVGVAGGEPARARAEVVEGALGGEHSSRTLDGLEHDRRLVAEAAPTAAGAGPPRLRGRRGPKPFVSDDELLAAIKDDIANSPFRGEGHRKVWRRLRRRETRPVHASRKRVLRVMREAKLLSPHRLPAHPPCLHDGRITTDEPDVMWGTDGLRVETVEEGWVWTFVAVEHWNAECVGVHVAKHGDRFAALEPVAQGLEKYFGGAKRNAGGRRLQLREDHGSQYTSQAFIDQTDFWGLVRSYAFVRQPETNGVAERFNRTLKEQVFHGKIYRNAEEVRKAVRAFVEVYNREWLVEKNGMLSPLERRRQFEEARRLKAAG